MSQYYKLQEEFFVDMQRCIGCKSCEAACAECETNGEEPMIHVNYVNRAKPYKPPYKCVCTAKTLFVPMFALQMRLPKMNSELCILPILLGVLDALIA